MKAVKEIITISTLGFAFLVTWIILTLFHLSVNSKLFYSIIVVSICTFTIYPFIYGKPFSLNIFLLRLTIELFITRYMLISSLRALGKLTTYFADSKLDNVSPVGYRLQKRVIEENLKILQRFKNSKLSNDEKISVAVVGFSSQFAIPNRLEWYLSTSLEGYEQFMHYIVPTYLPTIYPVNQTLGMQSALFELLLTKQPITSFREAKNFIARVNQFPVFFDQIMEELDNRARPPFRIIPPKFSLQAVYEQMEKVTPSNYQDANLFKHFKQKVENIPGLSPNQINSLLKELETSLVSKAYPTINKFKQFLKEQEKSATEEDGVWKFTFGEKLYTFLIKFNTTTSLTPKQIHEIGLSEVKRLQDRAKAILKEEGYSVDDSNFGSTLNSIWKDKKFQFSDNDDGRAEIIQEYKRILEEVEEGLDNIFDVKPSIGVNVVPVPTFQQQTAPPAFYFPPSLDRTVKGQFFANLREVSTHAKPTMKDLAYHEGIPGHHYQICIAQDQKNIPIIRRLLIFNAYAEGWGLYAEQLGEEQGWYKNNWELLGFLQAEIWRAARLVVDTGIHSGEYRWTRKQAVEYMLKNTGLTEGDAKTEVDRYIVMPGQALGYKIGQLEIIRLREKARKKLGNKFDIRKFHNTILTCGSVPLEILETIVDNWISRSE